jgi:hypothetical protein
MTPHSTALRATAVLFMSRAVNAAMQHAATSANALRIRPGRVLILSQKEDLLGMPILRDPWIPLPPAWPWCRRFCFCAHTGGVCKLEVAICDIKFGLGWASKTTLIGFVSFSGGAQRLPLQRLVGIESQSL